MRVCITCFGGWGNSGDEGVLLAMIDSLGDNEYIVCTSLPAEKLLEYQKRLPESVVEVRQIYDVRDDYDIFLLGGGGLSWGFGWRQAINAFWQDKPSMNYGVGYNWHELYRARLNTLYSAFLGQFDAITVRDKRSLQTAVGIRENSALPINAPLISVTCCPSINLKEEKFDDCPKNMIAVCPRYEDYVQNEPHLIHMGAITAM